MISSGRTSLRAGVLLRVAPLMLAFCLALWATAAWRAHVQNVESLTETLRQRLEGKLELMEMRFDAIGNAVADVAQSSVMVGALTGQDVERVALPYLRSIRLAQATKLNAALLDYRGETILVDRLSAWRRPALLAPSIDLAMDGGAVHWLEAEALHFLQPIHLADMIEGFVLVSVSTASMFEGLDPGIALIADLKSTAQAYAMLEVAGAHGEPSAVDGLSRFVVEDGMLDGLMIAPLRREAGLAMVVEKRIGGVGVLDHPVQQYLAAVFLLVLLMGGFSVHLAASGVTRPIHRLIAESQRKGLQIDDAAPDDACEINDLRKRFRAAAQDVEMALLRERELNSKQRMFVSMVSHEFRTPLAIIDGSAGALLRRRARMSEEAVAQKLATIRTSVARLVRLMEGALVSSSLESGTLKLALKPMDLRDVVATLIEERRAITADATFSVDLDALPESILVDERLVYSMIDNLLSNAVKYTREPPRIRVRGWTEGRLACVAVIDNGVGIPASELPRIGERFFRASTAEGVAGTGIGVSMVSMVASLHGGGVTVDSVVGEGSTFTVRLPVAGPDSHVDAGENESDPFSLWRVVYRSRATSTLDASALATIIAHASQANARIGVTGCLMRRDDQLAQVLEGRRSDLERMVALIRRDRRHTGFETVLTGPAGSRAYPDWSMCDTPPPGMGDLADALVADIARRTGADCASGAAAA